MHLGDDWAKELVIICDHVHCSPKNEQTQDCCVKNHVTLKQEMNGQ